MKNFDAPRSPGFRCSLPQAILATFAAVLLLAGIAGCGDTKTIAAISGSVSLDGSPLDNGAISFYPVAGGSEMATQSAGATIGPDGRYQTEIAPGRYRVEITSSKVIGQRKVYEDMADSPMEDILEEVVPAWYNTKSNLTQDIALETATVDFALTSERPAKEPAKK